MMNIIMHFYMKVIGNIFHKLDEWSSLTAMGVIAMVRTQYGKTISGKEMKECVTVEDLYHLINRK